jgi:hypothetical protein
MPVITAAHEGEIRMINIPGQIEIYETPYYKKI